MSPSHRSLIRISSVLTLLLLSAAAITAEPAPEPPGVSRVQQHMQALPLIFEPAAQPDHFVARGAGYAISADGDGVALSLVRREGVTEQDVERAVRTGRMPEAGEIVAHHEVRLRPVGAKDLTAAPIDPTGGYSNYLLGSDRSNWRREVPHFTGVRYDGVYEGIDWVAYGNQSSLEYDFVVAPGASPDQIQLAVSGANELRVTPEGGLRFNLGDVTLEQPKPLAYQMIAGDRIAVRAEYALRDGQVGFVLGDYDSSHELTIDPVVVFSTYFGGSNLDRINDIVLDAAGNLIVAGRADSATLPGNGVGGNGTDIFITKISSALNLVMFTTVIGGSGNDIPFDLALDATENIIVTGETTSSDLTQVANAGVQVGFGGFIDGFLLRLSSAGTTVMNLTYLGGTAQETSRAVWVNGSDVWIAGETASQNFPTVNPITQTPVHSGGFDAFIARISLTPTSSTLLFSSYYGGGGTDAAFAIQVASNGSVYVAGETDSTSGNGFPVMNAFQAQNAGDFDAFLICLTPGTGATLTFSTFLGGGGTDNARALSVAADGTGVLTGSTASGSPDLGVTTPFPTSSPLQATHGGGGSDVWITRIANLFATFPTISFSTYWGGNGNDFPVDLHTDGAGNYFIVGSASSTDFPLVDPSQTFNAGGLLDAFYMQIALGGFPGVISSSYLGGSLAEFGRGVTADSSLAIYAVGGTESTNFPIAAPLFGTNFGNEDGFITKLGSGSCTISLTGSPALYHGGNVTGAVTVTASAPGCPWAVTSSSPEITITGGGSGVGNGTITFTIAQNNTGNDRTLNITAGSVSVQITQLGEIGIFADVDAGDFFFGAAQLMSTLNITDGCAANPLRFCPGTPITRGQMAVFVVRAKFGGDNFTFSSTPTFTDVPATHIFFKWIQKLAELGITSGCGPGLFCPDVTIPRAQAAVFLIRLRYGSDFPFQFPPGALFTDVSAAGFFFPWIQELAETGITTGCGVGVFCPGNTVTRGQMALFIVRTGFNLLLPASVKYISGATVTTGAAGGSATTTLTGVNTNFVQGTTVVSLGPDITVTLVTVNSPTSVTVSFDIGAAADTEPRSIVVSTGTEEAVLPNAFTVN